MSVTQSVSKSRPTCPRCGSGNIIYVGYKYRKGAKLHLAQCKNCGAIFTAERIPLGEQHG